MNDPLHHR